MANYCSVAVKVVGDRATDCAYTAGTLGRWLDSLPEVEPMADGSSHIYGSVAWSAYGSLLTEEQATIPYTELCERFGTRMEIYSQEDTFEEHFIIETDGSLSTEETRDITNVCLIINDGLIDVEESQYDCGSLTEDMVDEGIFANPSAVPFEEYAELAGKYCAENLYSVNDTPDPDAISAEILRRLNDGETEFALNGFSGEWTI